MKRYNCGNHSAISDKNIDFVTKLKNSREYLQLNSDKLYFHFARKSILEDVILENIMIKS
jgi:hypothetical protein